MEQTVGEVASATGLTVRTLHHYDEIGLVVPSGRSAAGYRLYAPEDVARLHRVCTYRELGFSLDDIAALLSDDVSVADELRRQHQLVVERIDHLRAIQTTIETMIEAESMNVNLTAEEKFEVFGDFDPDEHAAEAHERWGETDAYRESDRRTTKYTKDDWVRMKQEMHAIEEALAGVLRDGRPAQSVDAMALAEKHRIHIDTWFYPCDHQMHRGLAELYVSDERFAAHYDDRQPGLARYLHDAVLANAESAEPLS